MRRFVACFNFSCTLIGNRPKSAPTIVVIVLIDSTILKDLDNNLITNKKNKKDGIQEKSFHQL